MPIIIVIGDVTFYVWNLLQWEAISERFLWLSVFVSKYSIFWRSKPSNPFEDGFSSSEEPFDEETTDENFYDAIAMWDTMHMIWSRIFLKKSSFEY